MTRKEESSHRDAVKRIKEAETFAVKLPGLGYVRIPRPENLAFYVALALLVAAMYIDWPLVGPIGIGWPTAVAIGVGHAITSRAERTSSDTAAATAAAIDQLHTEIRRLDERLDEMLRRNGEGDQAPAEGTDRDNK